MGKVRLCDIASDAGVSVSAVSRILSCDNSRKHSDETKKRVIAVAEKLGWFDSVSDKAIKAKKPLRVRRLYSSSVNAYQKALFDKGFNKAFDVVSSHIPVELVDDNEELAVVFGDEFDNVSDVPVIHVGFMALSGCFNIVADLIKAFSSFENKAFIGNRIYDSGFELSEYAFSLDPVSGYEAAGRLLGKCSPSLIVVSDDNIAAGVLKRVAALNIPVIGFGNFPISEEIGLSSFAVDYFSMGYLAGIMIEHHQSLSSDIEVPVSFIERTPLPL